MKANIGISEDHLKAVSTILNRILSDEYLLYTKTRNYHWNVEGDNFIELHKFYQEQYEQIDEIIDEVAERIRFLGQYPDGRLKDFLKSTQLTEQEYTSDQKVQLKNLLNDHESIIINIRKQIGDVNDKYGDQGTADFITGVMELHEKMAWFIRSYLK